MRVAGHAVMVRFLILGMANKSTLDAGRRSSVELLGLYASYGALAGASASSVELVVRW